MVGTFPRFFKVITPPIEIIETEHHQHLDMMRWPAEFMWLYYVLLCYYR